MIIIIIIIIISSSSCMLVILTKPYEQHLGEIVTGWRYNMYNKYRHCDKDRNMLFYECNRFRDIPHGLSQGKRGPKEGGSSNRCNHLGNWIIATVG